MDDGEVKVGEIVQFTCKAAFDYIGPGSFYQAMPVWRRPSRKPNGLFGEYPVPYYMKYYGLVVRRTALTVWLRVVVEPTSHTRVEFDANTDREKFPLKRVHIDNVVPLGRDDGGF